jgi:hypothetical protein
MPMAATPPATRKMTIIAQDPAVKRPDGGILTTQVEIPAERLERGPWGYRVQVIDYDAATRKLWKPRSYQLPREDGSDDPYHKRRDDTLLNDPRFHAQNVYAIVMRILARFEYALGRRVGWGFATHQLKVAPHAFADANAFYTRKHEALLFGYFRGRGGATIYSCLSHDVVAHEATHALLDGLRSRYLDPSSPDQAAFHEGFADVVALLSVFALPDVVSALLERDANKAAADNGARPRARPLDPRLIPASRLEAAALKESTLMGLAEQMGDELSAVRGQPLRRSTELAPAAHYIDEEEFLEPHRRGEILVSAMMNAFINVWTHRLKRRMGARRGQISRELAVEEGARAADYLMTMAIRALDYCAPVHLEFRDFLSALVTADREIRPDDSAFGFRAAVLASFGDYGIRPAVAGRGNSDGYWRPPAVDKLIYSRTRFESLLRDPAEVFRFVFENRRELGLYDGVYARVLSVRPCLRVGLDGFFLRETVAEYMQEVKLKARELKQIAERSRRKVRTVTKPEDMPADQEVILRGGGTLIFDEYGRLKFHISNRLNDTARQTTRLQHLWDYGHFSKGASAWRQFAYMHRLRAFDDTGPNREGWY